MKLKVNRRDFVDTTNILYFKPKNKIVWVYLKSGYPKIIKSECSLQKLRLCMLNMGILPNSIEVRI